MTVPLADKSKIRAVQALHRRQKITYLRERSEAQRGREIAPYILGYLNELGCKAGSCE
jgi:hypothetical protein